MYSASGFWTMARYALPILTLVWNNLNYQTVRTNSTRSAARWPSRSTRKFTWAIPRSIS
jgi:thiamine pyrophosphate-dependent acetolactate synthase large subunit-like protein